MSVRRIILKTFIFILMFSVSFAISANAQSNKTIKGIVKDAAGVTLPGVSVQEKGTTNGVVTDVDGKYELKASTQATLVFSFIGMQTQEIAVAGRSVVDVVMSEDLESLDEVVVTALGIKREKKALGYAVTEVKGAEVAEIKENNLVNSLSGKLAGVQVTKPSGGPGAATRVVVRGVSQLSGYNQPLYVIDGIPIINDIDGNAENKDHGGVDMGDGMSSVSSDNIESINILKGPSATALYGARGANGVIVITTKSGGKTDGLGIEINSSVSFEEPLIYPDYQTQYSHGSEGKLPVTEDERKSWHSMWGPKIEGQEFVDFSGETRNLKTYDNYDSFLQRGVNINNSVSLSGGSDKTNYRFSFSNLDSEGILPNTDFKRKNFSFRGGTYLGNTKRFKVDSKITYVKEEADNRPITGASPRNVLSAVSSLPNTYDIKWLKNYKDVNGLPIGYTSTQSNPYWLAKEVKNSDTRNRVFGFVSLDVEITKYLSLLARGGTDFYTRESFGHIPKNTPGMGDGMIEEYTKFSREDNLDLILSFDKDVTKDLNIAATLGANRMYRYSDRKYLRADKFALKEMQNIVSGEKQTYSKTPYEKEVQSVFGSLRAAYKNFLFLEATARNDWSSSLPSDNRSYFYPSVNASVILSEVIEMPKEVSFLKLRSSWAEVGSDTDPYQLSLNYGLDNIIHNGAASGSISNSNSPKPGLKPTNTKSIEFGLNSKFFNNRFGIDLTWYKQNTFNQIMPLEVSSATSYNSVIINAGEIENKGYELMLYAKPLQNYYGFDWDINVNYTQNENTVVELTDKIDIYTIMSGAGTNSTVSVRAEAGKSYGEIYGKTYVKDNKGNIVLDSEGLPVISQNVEALGNVTPDFMFGVRNNISYRNFKLGFLVDCRFGGEFYAGSEAGAYASGKHKNTIFGREAYLKDDSFVPKGVQKSGTDEDPVYTANEKNVKPSEYYGRVSQIDEHFITSSDFIKLREISFRYTLPKSIINKVNLQSASIALVGRNLFYIHKKSDNLDPESMSYTAGNGQGIEHSSMPSTRTYGVSINLKF